MANKFTNFLGNTVKGFFSGGNLRDQQHAARLYRDNFFDYAPKAGWLYYVLFNINKPSILNNVYLDKEWVERYAQRVGLLAKTVDMPRYTIKAETLNQYNRKTIVQTGISYNNITISLHNDMVNSTSELWRNYFLYYYADGRYYDDNVRGFRNFAQDEPVFNAYADNKYKDGQYRYGYSNRLNIPFFNSIEIYELNRKKFTGFKLINPIITEWRHDQLDQTNSQKMLTNNMTIAYENVIYLKGDVKLDKPAGFATTHYDSTPSPLSIGGKGSTSLFGVGGIIPGAADVFGTITNPEASLGDYIGALAKTKNIIDNAKKLNKAALKEEGYSILGSTLGNIQNQSNVGQGIDQTVSGITKNFSPVRIDLFKGNNPSADGIKNSKAGNI